MKYAEFKVNNSIVGSVHAYVRYDNQSCKKMNNPNQGRRAIKNGFLATLSNIKILDITVNNRHYKESTLKRKQYRDFLNKITKQLENEVLKTPACVKRNDNKCAQSEVIQYCIFESDDAAKKHFGIL